MRSRKSTYCKRLNAFGKSYLIKIDNYSCVDEITEDRLDVLLNVILQKAMKENNIDLNEVDREVLGTEHEKTKASSDEA